MSFLKVIGEQFLEISRTQSRVWAETQPVQTDDQVNQRVLDQSQLLYLNLVKIILTQDPGSRWETVKTKLGSHPSTFFEPTDQPLPKLVQHFENYDYQDSNSVWLIPSDRVWPSDKKVLAQFYELGLGIQQYQALNQQELNQGEAIFWRGIVQNGVATQMFPETVSPVSQIKYSNLVTIHYPDIVDDLESYRELFINLLAGFETSVKYGFTKVNVKPKEGTYLDDQILFVQILAAWLARVREVHFWSDRYSEQFNQVWRKFESLSRSFGREPYQIRQIPASVESVYDDFRAELNFPYSYMELWEPLLQDVPIIAPPLMLPPVSLPSVSLPPTKPTIFPTPSLDPTKWYWRGDQGEWNPYDPEIQEILNLEIGDPRQTAVVKIRGTDYIIKLEPSGWRQIQANNPRRRREVLPPVYLQN